MKRAHNSTEVSYGDKINEYASLLLSRGPEHTMRVLRAEYPNKGYLRNIVRKVRNQTLSRMDPFNDFSPTHLENSEIRSFSLLPRTEQIRHQLVILKGGNVYRTADTMIRSLPVVPSFVRDLKLSAEEIASIKAQSRDRIEQRSSEAVILSRREVNSFLEWAKATVRNCTLHTEPDLLVAVALVTGRRAAEIFLSGSFEAIASQSQSVYWACFKGQVKAGLRDPNKCYNVPLLAPVVDVQRSVHRIRQRWNFPDGSVPADVNRRYASTIRRAAQKRLGRLHEKLAHLHAARELYAMITFEMCQPHTYSLHGWIRKVLGHADLDQTKHYSNIQIRN